MVMPNRRRLMIGTLCVCLILMVFKCQITESGWRRSHAEIAAKQQNYKAAITAQELDDFIKLWPQVKELGFMDNLIVSYQVDRPSKFIDWKGKIWFVYHRWDADRFFYVQQRTAALLYTLGVRRTAKALIRMLENREEDVAKQLLDVQKKRSQEGEDDLSELQLVAEREKILKKLFD